MRPKCRGVLPLGYKLLWGIKEVMTEFVFLTAIVSTLWALLPHHPAWTLILILAQWLLLATVGAVYAHRWVQAATSMAYFLSDNFIAAHEHADSLCLPPRTAFARLSQRRLAR